MKSSKSLSLESGELELFKQAFDSKRCQFWMKALLDQLVWHKDYYEIHHRRFEIPRLQAWVADDGIQYSYSNNLLTVQKWTPLLLEIKSEMESLLKHRFNSVLLTYYRDGRDHVTWHADDENELGDQPKIGSLSLGVKRIFQYKRNDDSCANDLVLEEGDVLLMLPEFQHHWQHQVPEELDVYEGRLNLTFRYVVNRHNTAPED